MPQKQDKEEDEPKHTPEGRSTGEPDKDSQKSHEHKKKKKDKDKKKKKHKDKKKKHRKEDSDEDLKDDISIMTVMREQINASKNGAKQLHWREEEDEFLCKALAKYGLRNWDRVTRLIPYRTPKAVQNRWNNFIGVLNSPHFKNMRKKYEKDIKRVTDDTIAK